MLTVQVKINVDQKEGIDTILDQVKKHISLGYNKGTGANGNEGYSFNITDKTPKTRVRKPKKVEVPVGQN